MGLLCELLVSLVRLGEAELRVARQSVQAMVAHGVLLLVAGLVAAFAGVVLVYAEYAVIAASLGPAVAALLCGLSAAILAAVLWAVASRRR